jgi:hypothetical protein
MATQTRHFQRFACRLSGVEAAARNWIAPPERQMNGSATSRPVQTWQKRGRRIGRPGIFNIGRNNARYD